MTSLKVLGIREPVITYDDLKVDLSSLPSPPPTVQAECVRKRQYGYVESALLLAADGKFQNRTSAKVQLTSSAPGATTTVANGGRQSVSGGRPVNSKILGTFTPSVKVLPGTFQFDNARRWGPSSLRLERRTSQGAGWRSWSPGLWASSREAGGGLYCTVIA